MINKEKRESFIIIGKRMEVVAKANEYIEEGKQIEQLLTELLFQEDEEGNFVHSHGNEPIKLSASIVSKILRFTKSVLRVTEQQLELTNISKHTIENLNAIIKQLVEEQKVAMEKSTIKEEEMYAELHSERSQRIKNGISLREAQDRLAQLEGEKYGVDPPTREASVKREREE